ncbi:MAG: DUF1730 domain-containing protein [Clostridiales bacterium]|nr:DUF1730 domain-containing protein [Clostridiales bacterium]
MDELVKTVMDKFTPAWGVCSYAPVADKLIACAKIKDIPDRATSILVALFPYYMGRSSYQGSNISAYAAVRDYHEVVSDRLNSAVELLQEAFPGHGFAAFCDNSPIPEVKAAVEAGLGAYGDNGLLINPKYGSWVFIGEIITSLPLAGKTYEDEGKSCLNCGECSKHCPTRALGQAGGFKKEICLSHISQKKGQLTPKEELMIKNSASAWGCDICQLVCPMNRGAQINPLTQFSQSFKPHFQAGDEIKGRAFAWRGREVIERNLKLIEGRD